VRRLRIARQSSSSRSVSAAVTGATFDIDGGQQLAEG
jgi:hypothetical protein